MSKYREVYDKAMPKSKVLAEKNNIIIAYFARPLSILVTIPLVGTNITPITVTKISVFASIIGFAFLAFGKCLYLNLVGWFFFYVWVILDGVDGNLARYKNQTSAIGEVWDAFGGYIAMILTYFGAGIASFYEVSRFSLCEPYWLLIIGGGTALCSVLPRLMMHKVRNTLKEGDNITTQFTDKKSFGLVQSIATNITALTGLFQVIFLVCILFRMLNIFTIGYFIVNFGLMVISLHKLLKPKN